LNRPDVVVKGMPHRPSVSSHREPAAPWVANQLVGFVLVLVIQMDETGAVADVE
jgi:hypothetical protein